MAVADGLADGVAVTLGVRVAVRAAVGLGVAVAATVGVRPPLAATIPPPSLPSPLRNHTPMAANTIPRMPSPVHPMAWRAGVLKNDCSQFMHA
ncbi:MAG TPA: hypothetical protein PKD75_04210 [Tepidiformaceae bacterium]|nr:hypothetical protein [Tepidiformaceae bacterium]